MCRWAWLGQPVLIEELLFKSPHGIVDQSLHVRMGAEPQLHATAVTVSPDGSLEERPFRPSHPA